MHWLKKNLALLLLLGFFPVGFGMAAQPADEATKAGAAAGLAKEEGAKEHGLPPSAVRLREEGFLSNSMFVTWIVAAGLIVFARVAMNKAKLVPDGAQNFWELVVEGLYQFIEGIVGAKLVKKTFWFFATIFIFILATNWFGLLPGVG